MRSLNDIQGGFPGHHPHGQSPSVGDLAAAQVSNFETWDRIPRNSATMCVNTLPNSTVPSSMALGYADNA